LNRPPIPQGTAGPPPPPTALELTAYTIDNLSAVSIMVGLFGGVALYVCSFPATIAGVMYGDRLYFTGSGSRVLSWCGSLLDRHMSWFIWYIVALLFGPLGLMWISNLIGFGKLAAKAREKYGLIFSGRPYPGQSFVRLVAGTLFLPFIPTIVAAFAACMIGLLVLLLIGLYGAVELARFGGFRYFITRLAVRDGISDALKRRRR